MFYLRRRGSHDIPPALDSILATRFGLASLSSTNSGQITQQPNVIQTTEENGDKMAPPLPVVVGQLTPADSRSAASMPVSSVETGNLTSLLSPLPQPKLEPGLQVALKLEPPGSAGGGLPPGHSPVSTPGDSSRPTLGGLSPLNEDGNPSSVQVTIKQEIIMGSAPPSVANMDCCSTPVPTDSTTIKCGKDPAVDNQKDQPVPYGGPPGASAATGLHFGHLGSHNKKQGVSGGNLLKRPTLPWVAHDDDDMLVPPSGDVSALYDYSAVSTALVWDAPPPSKRTFPLRLGDDRWNQNNNDNGSGPWFQQSPNDGHSVTLLHGSHTSTAAAGPAALHHQQSVNGTDENLGR